MEPQNKKRKLERPDLKDLDSVPEQSPGLSNPEKDPKPILALKQNIHISVSSWLHTLYDNKEDRRYR